MNKFIVRQIMLHFLCFHVGKVGGPSIAAAHEGQKVGGPRPARPNSFRRLWSLLYNTHLNEERQLKSSSHAGKVFQQWMTLREKKYLHMSIVYPWLGMCNLPMCRICFIQYKECITVNIN